MGFVENFIKNPVKVTVFVILLVMFGLIVIYRMPIQLIPDVQIPTLTIETFWPGASPQEIEKEIINEQEEQLKGVEGVTKMSSESMDSRGTITLEFAVGTNLDAAITTVNARLQQVREYPIEADKPVISTSNAANQAIAWFILNQRLPSADDFDTFAAKHSHLADSLQAHQDHGKPGPGAVPAARIGREASGGEGLAAAASELESLPPLCGGRHRGAVREGAGRFAIERLRRRGRRAAGDCESGAACRAAADDRRRSPGTCGTEHRRFGWRLLGRKAAMGRPHDGPLPRSPASCRHGDHARRPARRYMCAMWPR